MLLIFCYVASFVVMCLSFVLLVLFILCDLISCVVNVMFLLLVVFSFCYFFSFVVNVPLFVWLLLIFRYLFRFVANLMLLFWCLMLICVLTFCCELPVRCLMFVVGSVIFSVLLWILCGFVDLVCLCSVCFSFVVNVLLFCYFRCWCSVIVSVLLSICLFC